MKATEEQIQAWKNSWKGDVYELEIEGKYCYIRSFDRATMKCVLSNLTMKVSGEGAEIDAGKILDIGAIGLENCWLDGDKEILSDDRLYIAACMQVGELFNIAETKLKKV